jgi:hypothetical protein
MSRKHILAGATLAALFGLITLLPNLAEGQITGACPTNQFVSVIGNNIPLTACSQPSMANLSGTLTASQGGTGIANANASTITLGGPLVTTGAGTATLAFPTASRTQTFIDYGAGATVLETAGTVSATTGLSATPLSMTCMRTAAGLMMTGSASGTNYGLTYTPGTGAFLVGTATSSSSTSDVATCDVVLPPWYIAASNITVKVGCFYTDASSSATVHTMTTDAYLNTVAGAQGSTLVATAAQACPITTSAQQTFTITGATLLPGSLLTLKFTLNMTNGGGASTGNLTSVVLN